MDLLGTGINAAVIAIVGLVLGYLGKTRFAQVDRRFERLEDEMDRRFAEFGAQMDRRFAEVDRRFAEVDRRFVELGRRVDKVESTMNARMDTFERALSGMRTDLTNVALALGAKPQAEAGG